MRSILDMVGKKTAWIAATQQLLPRDIEIVQSDRDPDCFYLVVPRREFLWYIFFFSIIWGIPTSITCVFLIVTDEVWVRMGVTIGSFFIVFVGSLERKIELCKSTRMLSVCYRFLFLDRRLWQRRIEFGFLMTIEAAKNRDVEGFRQIEIMVFDGRRKLYFLLKFNGWKDLQCAEQFASELNSLVSGK